MRRACWETREGPHYMLCFTDNVIAQQRPVEGKEVALWIWGKSISGGRNRLYTDNKGNVPTCSLHLFI
jgi:hypothetical protein